MGQWAPFQSGAEYYCSEPAHDLWAQTNRQLSAVLSFFFGEVWVKVSENNQHTVESAFAVSSVDGLCHPCFYYLSSREFDFLCIRRTRMKRDSKQAAV